jgi:hypothetical protein
MTSSTWRELESVKMMLLGLKGKSVIWKTDNKNVLVILSTGSSKPQLQKKECLNVNEICRRSEISLTPEWVLRSKNTEAYFFSWCCDSNNWTVLLDWKLFAPE